MQKNKTSKHILLFLSIICLSWDISGQQLTPFKNDDGKYGIKKTDGKEVVPPIYENVIIDEASGLVKVQLNNNKNLFLQ